jgi:uncharacterized membrane protein
MGEMIPSRALRKIVMGRGDFSGVPGRGRRCSSRCCSLETGAMKSKRNPAADLDTHFAGHSTLTLLHVIPGALFMVLGPLQFIGSLRKRYPEVHRWSGRIFLTASTIIGVTGLTMAAGNTIGGWDEKSAIFLFGSFFLFALGKALWHAMHREFAAHREWMIRGYGIGLAVATIRPIMGIFFATAIARGHTPQPQEFFGTAFWIGFTLQAIVAEIWIRYTRTAGMGMRTNSAPSSVLRSRQ